MEHLKYMFCRVCGTKVESDMLSQHEAICLQKKHVEIVDDPQSPTKQGSSSTTAKAPETTGAAPKTRKQNKDNRKKSYMVYQEETIRRDPTSDTGYVVNKEETVIEVDPTKMNKQGMPPGFKIPWVEQGNESQEHAINASLNRRSSKAVEDIPMSQSSPSSSDHSSSPRTPSPQSPGVRVSDQLEHCKSCSRDIPVSRIDDHMNNVHPKTLSKSTRKWTPPKISKMEGGRQTRSSVGPAGRFQFCYICGRQFGSLSIGIHEPQCLKKWRVQNEQLPRRLRRPEPKKPQPIGGGGWSADGQLLPGTKRRGSTSFDVEPHLDSAWQSHLQNLVPCSHCKRTFFPDRIMKHEESCVERPKSRTYADLPDHFK